MPDLHATARLSLKYSGATLLHAAAARTAAEILARHEDAGLDDRIDGACREFRTALVHAIAAVRTNTA